MRYVLIDETNGATTSSGEKLTPQLLALACQAMNVYLNRDVAQHWGHGGMVRPGSGPTDIQPNEVPAHIQPALDVQGAIAYHDVYGAGLPDIYDGITLSDTLFGPSGWSVAMTHEIAETEGDPETNALRADGRGKLFAQETADPVEVQSYPITLKSDGEIADVPNTAPGLAEDGSFTMYVANFVLDAYFTPGHTGPYDYMTEQGMPGANGPAGPFQLVPAGGGDYQIWEIDPQNEQQVFGEEKRGGSRALRHAIANVGKLGDVWVAGSVAHRAAKKAHPSSRAHRRGVRMKAAPALEATAAETEPS